MVDQAQGGQLPARVALTALLAALEREAAGRVPGLASAADAAGRDAVAALFTQEAPRRELDPSAAAKADARAFTQPVGHLTWKARLTRNPDELARLASASDPRVVRNVLLNPRLTEGAVVRVAARRPVRPEVLAEIWRSPRWSARHEVRRALAFNPYLPPELGARLVPLLRPSDWSELAQDGAIHPEVLAQAARLLDQARSPRAPGGEEGREGVTSTNPSPRDAFRKE
jgi:hypothetical protein